MIIGKKYIVKTKERNYEGIFVNENETHFFLKLGSGYNVGIDKSKVLESTEAKNNNISKEGKDTKKKSLKKETSADVLILHTGGTIASKVDYKTGGVSSKFSPEEILALFPELDDIATIDSKLVSNMPSDDMNFTHYNELIKEIEDNHDKFKGIIITHGTDTLHYTSAALSFALKGINIPIVLVGSQRSSDRPSSDAAINLLNATYFVTKNIPGVFVCMHESIEKKNSLILEGVNVKKLHSSRRDAFKQVNSKPIASLDYKNDVFELHRKPFSNNLSNSDDTFLKYDEKLKIGLIHSRPNMFSKEFEIYQGFDGMILVGTGLGHFPITKFDDNTKENSEIFKSIQKLSKTIPTVMTTQTVSGRVNLNVYSPGRALKEAGVLGHNCNIIYETAYMKLAYLLSNFKEDVEKLYSENLVGELPNSLI